MKKLCLSFVLVGGLCFGVPLMANAGTRLTVNYTVATKCTTIVTYENGRAAWITVKDQNGKVISSHAL